MSTFRHCEERSDEAIQHGGAAVLDCFASLAMTSFYASITIFGAGRLAPARPVRTRAAMSR